MKNEPSQTCSERNGRKRKATDLNLIGEVIIKIIRKGLHRTVLIKTHLNSFTVLKIRVMRIIVVKAQSILEVHTQ